MNRTRMIGLIVLAVLFLAVSVYYWMTPAGSLLPFVSGYQAGSHDVHTKHAIAALILAIGCGVLAWFVSAKTEASEA